MWGWAAGRGGLQLQPEEPGDADRSGTTWIAGHTAKHAVQPALSDMWCPSFGSSPRPRGSPCTPPKGVSQPVSLPGPLCTSVSSAGQTAASRPPPAISLCIAMIFYSKPNRPFFLDFHLDPYYFYYAHAGAHVCTAYSGTGSGWLKRGLWCQRDSVACLP